jgi:hypothetical protein
MKTINLPLEKLIAYAGNPRRNDHAVEAVAAAIKRFGFRVPVLAKSDGTLIDGHLRIKAAKRLGMTEVPVVLCDDLSEAEIKALRISINRMAELAEWDEELLMAELEGLAAEGITMDDVGFDLDALEALGASAEPEGNPEADAEPQIDNAEELRAKWGVEHGQLWELGDHRLLCGDSSKIKFGEDCPTLFFDPPWDAMQPTARRDNVLAFADGQRLHDVVDIFGAPNWLFVWDCVSSWYTPNRPLRRMKLCAFYGQIEKYNSDGAHYGDAGEQREVFNSRGSYTFKPDPRGKHLSDVFPAPITKLHAESEHSHSKPMDWIRMLIANCTTGDVYDPYAGSGTCMMACEQLGRKCRAIEISPAYVAVALQRWADATGKTPRLVP